MNEIVLVAFALLPAIILCCFVYRKDRVEKEPIGFLLLLLFLGALTAIPVVLVSDPINYAIDSFFTVFATEDGYGYYLDTVPYHIYLLVSNMVGVACIEEGFKWLVLFFVTRKSKHFNSYFDGLIYAVFISLGFAAFENVLYTLDYGFSTAVVRAFTAVPGHMFDGVIMGTFYSMWNIRNEASKIENVFRLNGIIDVKNPISGRKELVLSYVMPVLTHGIYDYLCSVSSWLATVLFAVLLIVLYITQFRRISKMSKNDADEIGYAISIVCEKYPVIKTLICSSAQNEPSVSGIRQTHNFTDFEFIGPQSPVVDVYSPDMRHIKKSVKVYIDDSE